MDNKFIAAHLDCFCYTNIDLIRGDVRGMILCFTGLGHIATPAFDMTNAPAAAERNLLYMTPRYNPWSWMNPETVSFVDSLVEAAMEKWNVPKDVPIGLYGRSMGGYSVFHYAVESKHNIVAGDLNCPACNLEYEIYCNRTPILTSFFQSAMAYCDDFDTYVREHSPLNMIGKLKKIPYRFAVGMQDMLLAPAQHSLKMIPLMRSEGYEVEKVEYPAAGHCTIGADGLRDEHEWLMSKMLGK